MNKPLVLVVENDTAVCNLITTTLETHDYRFHTAGTGEAAILEAVSHNPDIVLLDLGLPDMDGIDIITKIRTWSNMPIIVVSARSEDTDKIIGLNIGADDYITKPFNLLELIARVKSNLRRYVTLGNYEDTCKEILKSGALELNTLTKEVKIDGENIKMTPIEYKIIELLLENKGRVFSIDEIYEKVWNEESFNSENTVAVHIRRIREKIEINPKEPRFLKVVWGVGYKIEKF